MLELQPKPQFSVVIPPKLLQEGYLVTFSSDWPSTHDAIREKTFRIDAVNQVPYDLSYILPTGASGTIYRDVDFSNGSGTYQESIYPEQQNSLFEVLVGFKPGNYLSHWYVPAGKSVHQLEFSSMYPDLTDNTKKYLGARSPEDSPYDDPRIKVYLVKDLAPVIMRLYALPGVDYEKIVVGLTINKCLMRVIEAPTEDQKLKSKVIRYYDYLRW
ncbi:hypothetical protein LCGC14_1997610 [marine sediment metagenome]|uniref:Uncharacterized protein n=1 Tax=marine sediment metagenome TaxID=412755 RepID=A0A0F9F3Y9_9ZZZZ